MEMKNMTKEIQFQEVLKKYKENDKEYINKFEEDMFEPTTKAMVNLQVNISMIGAFYLATRKEFEKEFGEEEED